MRIAWTRKPSARSASKPTTTIFGPRSSGSPPTTRMPSSSWPRALGWFWLSHSHLAEGRRRLTDALARSRSEGSVRAAALTALGGIASWEGDADHGPAWIGEGIARWRELGDVAELAYALETLGWGLFLLGDNLPSLAAFEESLELRRTSGDSAR